MIFQRAVWVALVVCMGLGCAKGSTPLDDSADAGEGEGKDSGVDPNAVKIGGLCERLATLQCEGEQACCDEPGRDYDECKKAMLDGCKKTLRFDDIAKRAEAGFDAARAKAAFEGFEALAEKCDPNIAEWGSSVEGLRGMLQGSVADGGNCAPRGAATDTAVVGAALSSCEEPETYACQPRSTQLSGRPDWTCDEKSAAGDPCFSDYNCEDGLYCDNPKQLLTASCKPRKAVGAACSFPSACESLACKDNKCAARSVAAAYCLKE